MRQLVLALLLVLGLTAVLMVVGLFAIRFGRELHERRREARHGDVRTVILTALMGEPDEAGLARIELRSRTGPAWAQVEDQAFAMIPKVKGDSHDALVTLLLSKGAAAHAATLARSRSQVRRARGAHRLGALAQSDAVSQLLGLLRDKAFLVRRTAVRALLAPFVEVFGVVFLALALVLMSLDGLGLTHLQLVDQDVIWVLLAVSLLYAVVLTLAALVVEELSFRRYRGPRDLAIAIWASLEENIGYRQVNAWWRMGGSLEAWRKTRHDWGDMQRRGLGKT